MLYMELQSISFQCQDLLKIMQIKGKGSMESQVLAGERYDGIHVVFPKEKSLPKRGQILLLDE